MRARDILRQLVQNRPALFGLIVIGLMFTVGIFAQWIAPYHYRAQDLDAASQLPSWQHLLGTDELGRDTFSRLIWGARTASFVVVVTLILSTPLGIVLGAVAGYFGKLVDTIIMRITDILFAFPGFLFILLVAATVGPRIDVIARDIPLLDPLVKSGYIDYVVVVFVLALIGWAGEARLIRGQFLTLKERDYALAAKACGATDWRLIFRHILPNALAPLIVSLSMGAGGIILAEAFLSFLGIGIRPPNASWGAMIFDNYTFWRTRPFLVWIPGLTIGLVILAFNLLGDGLNDILNPKSSTKERGEK